jgi:outer membrane protein assembly factor BamD (BamD/ComL family)
VSPRAARSSHRIRLAGRNEDGQKELLLLVEARRADARGDFLSALTVLAEHERSYPAGRLSEEREVLHVKALVGLGRGAEARQVAANFRRQFPRSVLRHKIEDMLTTLQ